MESEKRGETGVERMPKSLFKYLPPERINVLKQLLIRFSQASSLNDTLELKPPLKGVAEPEKLKHIVRERLAPGLWSNTNPEKKRILDRICPGLPDLLGEIFLQNYTIKGTKAVEERYENNPTAVFRETDSNFGILSLSETAIDIRMWAHYADGGRGFLIEFDPTHSWFHGKRDTRDSFRHLRQVNYVSSRPTAYLLDTTELEFLYTKWAVWQDEREWRIIRNFNDHSKKLDGVDPYGNEILLFAIPPDSIRSVVLGFSATPEFEEALCAMLSGNQALTHVSLKRAVQSIETGQVDIAEAGFKNHHA